jgi:RNA polymerase sigma-70 factor, ECF subfamily
LTLEPWFAMIRSLLKMSRQAPSPDWESRTSPCVGDVTALLHRWNQGDAGAQAELLARLYPELKRVAQARMRLERADHTWQPTALVNEFFLQLAAREDLSWKSRAHFLAVASRAMRCLLIDYSRNRRSIKRGGGRLKLQIDELMLPGHDDFYDFVEVNDLLDRLAAEEPRMAQVVELRCFGGLTHGEIAETLGIDERTAKRDWQVARAWLFGQLRKR